MSFQFSDTLVHHHNTNESNLDEIQELSYVLYRLQQSWGIQSSEK